MLVVVFVDSCWLPIVTLSRRAILAFIVLPSHAIYVIVLGPPGGLSAIQGRYVKNTCKFDSNIV